MNFIKEIFKTDDYDLKVYRIFCGIGALFLPLYGIILQSIDPNAVDYISHRLIISFVFLAIVGLSYTKSEIYKRNFGAPVFMGLSIAIIWVVWIVYKNDFYPNYALGLFVTFCAIAIIYHNTALIILHTLLSFAITIFFIGKSENLYTDATAIILALIVITVLSVVTIFLRRNESKKLEEVNLQLEEKVNERTKEIKRNLTELEAQNYELEQFAKAVSHDLKTPLRGIVIFTQWIKSDYGEKLDENVIEMLDLIQDRGERMDKLLEGINSYRHIGRENTIISKVDLNALLDDLLTEKKFDKEQVKFEIGQLPIIDFDYDQMYEVFWNLISNSIKHNEKNDVQIEIGCNETSDYYEIYVKDNGIGIDVKYKERIFNLFETLQTKDESKTFGIGLALVKRIITKAGGDIWITNESDGAMFKFTIKKSITL